MLSKQNHHTEESTPFPQEGPLHVTGERVIPLVEETLEVGKRVVETGVVRVQKHTEERIELVEAPLQRVRYDVEHVAVDRVISEHPPIRYEGDTTIYPVVEENLVVTRELRLREEVRVTRIAHIVQERSTHRLRRESVRTERDGVEIGRTTETPDHTSPAAIPDPGNRV